MGMSKNIGAYVDISPILDAALAAGGATFRLPSAGKAHRWRQRAYFYRGLLHTHQRARLANILDTRPSSTPYDAIRMRLEGPIVIIDVEGEEIKGELLDGAGNPLTLPDVLTGSPRHDSIDELDDEDADMLADVRANLGLEVDDE